MVDILGDQARAYTTLLNVKIERAVNPHIQGEITKESLQDAGIEILIQSNGILDPDTFKVLKRGVLIAEITLPFNLF